MHRPHVGAMSLSTKPGTIRAWILANLAASHDCSTHGWDLFHISDGQYQQQVHIVWLGVGRARTSSLG